MIMLEKECRMKLDFQHSFAGTYLDSKIIPDRYQAREERNVNR